MAGAQPEPTEPRIIKKKKVQGGGSHGGAWKVAYADFVTAMMALFIVLWIMGQSQAVRQNVAQYFKNPGLLPGASGLLETSDIGGEIPTPGHSQDLQTPTPITPDLSSERGHLEEVKKRISEIIAQLPELSRLKDQVALEITEEGLRIELLDNENSHFFDLGSANLKAETQKLLGIIAQELGKLDNHITVEGHTDSRPYGTKNYTNWELSADRANAARRILEDTGVTPGQITSVRGFADRHLRNQQNPLDFQNRRVSVLVTFKSNSKQGPVDILKIQEKTKKSPQNPGEVGQPKAPAPAVLPKPLAPAARGAVGPPPAQVIKPEATAVVQPPGQKTTPPAPAPVSKEKAPPPGSRLEDQVGEEVRQLLQQEGLPKPAPGTTPNPARDPRTRLGW
jgi:chemotaxis protein MotB